MFSFSKKTTRYFAAAAVIFAFPPMAPGEETAAPPKAPEPLRVLHIGNSFSQNATRYLPDLAEAGGKNLEIFGAVLGGCSLERHAKHLRQAKAGEEAGSVYKSRPVLRNAHQNNNVSLPIVLKARPWDVVTIQQVSRQSFRPESFEPYATELIAEIRAAAPLATLWIHQTWAYRPDHSLYSKENLTQDQMQTGIVRAYEELGKRHQITHFLPSGLAVQMANLSSEWSYQRDANFDYDAPPEGALPVERSVYTGPYLRKPAKDKAPLLQFDAYHLNRYGQYLTACVWYEMLFEDSILKVDFTPRDFTPEQARSLRQLAHEAVAAYRRHGLSGGLGATAEPPQPAKPSSR